MDIDISCRCKSFSPILLYYSMAWDIRGAYAEYSGSIHRVYVCIGYVSGMYRVCIGNISKDTRCEWVVIKNDGGSD